MASSALVCAFEISGMVGHGSICGFAALAAKSDTSLSVEVAACVIDGFRTRTMMSLPIVPDECGLKTG